MRKITLFLLAILAGTASLSAATGWYNDFLTVKVNGVGTANNYYLSDSDPASGATALNGANFGTVNTLEISGCDMKYWSDTQDRTGGAFYYKVTSSDGLTDIVAPVEVIWDQTALTGNDFQGTKTTTINISNLLLQNGTYQLHVWAKSWGTGQGDSWLSNSSANYVSTFTISRPVIVTGANGITDNTSFPTLKAAFDSINAHSDQGTKVIEIKIAGNTTETASAVLNQPSAASWNSLTIYPIVAGVTISGTLDGNLIDLNTADNVTINGKLNKSGAVNSLTISNLSNTSGARTIRILNDAKSNTIQYCKIKGMGTSNGAGVIFFSTTTGADGNDNNIIEYCDIDAMGAAAVGIGSAGTSAKENSGNIIRYNNIYDFYLGNASTNATYGINIGANNTDWEITGNSLYQTAPRAYIATGTTYTFHYGIYVSASTGNNFLIKDNYIGGSAPLAGGTPWTITAGFNRPVGLYTSVGTTTASSVQNNTITNFDITTDYVTNANSAFIGYFHSAGSVNAGTIKGNTIGSATNTGAIVVKFNSAVAGSLVVGMTITTAAAATQVFSNNKIGGIVADFLGTVNRGHLYGVSTSGAGALTFTNDTIVNLEHKGSTYTAGQVNLRGITMGNIGITLTGNLISNLKATSTASMSVHGIYCNGTGTNNFSNNTIRDIKSDGTRVITTQGIDAGLVGLVMNANSTGNTVSGNTIYNLENTNTTVATDVYGINNHTLSATTATTINGNKIYNLKTASTNTAANVVGISITRGLTNTTNNMITLGDGLANAVSIVGIRKLGTAATQNNNFYNNTVLITGSGVGVAGTSYTAAFAKVYTATDDIKNNIFVNARSNAAGNLQKHYCINLNDYTTLTSDYNVVSYPGTGGLPGVIGTTDYTDPNVWVSTTGLDTHSKVAALNFKDSIAGDLTLEGVSVKDENLKVPALATVTTDFLGTTRNTKYTYAGAHEAALPFIFKAMQGTFSVGSASNSDFATLSDAIKSVNDALTVGGDIVFEINSDITEPSNFGLAKAMGPNKLTIRPNADADRTITFTQATANIGPYGHFVIGCATDNLNTALSDATVIPTGNVTIDGYAALGSTKRLKFTTSTSSLLGSSLITVIGGSNNIKIQNSILDNLSSSTTGTGNTPRCIYLLQFKGTTLDVSPSNILIQNNTINSGTQTSATNGIGVQCARIGSATTAISGLQIKNNFVSASNTCIEIYYANGVEISGNEIKVKKGTGTGGAYGIWLRGNVGNMNIFANKFTETSTSQSAASTYLIQTISVASSAANPFNTNIFNNTFSGMDRKATGSTAINQCYIGDSGFGTTKIYNNSFYLPALTQPTQAGYYNAVKYTGSTKSADIQNNIFISNDDAKSVLISDPITSGTMNYNIYFLHAGATNAKVVSTYATLDAFKQANPSLDINSKSVDVNFLDAAAGDLSLTGASIQDANLKVPSLAAVTTDITGKIRDASYTYAGAHESTLPFTVTSLKNATATGNVYKTRTGVEVRVNENSTIELYSVNGTLIDIANVNATYTRNLENGIYIVKINGKAIKFVK